MSHSSLHSLIAAALILLILPLVGCNDSGDPTLEQVLERAQEANAASEIASYHFTISIVQSAEGIEETESSVSEVYSLLPDRSKVITRSSFGDGLSETIRIGNVMYIRESEESQWRKMELPDDMLGEDAMELSRHLDVFFDSPVEEVTKLPSEPVGGVECWRYKVEHSNTLDRMVRQMEEESDLERRNMLKGLIEGTQSAGLTETREIWVGKDDYLIRQVKETQIRTSDGKHEFGFPNIIVPEGAKYTFTTTMSFSGFNDPLEIEAPVSVAS